MINGGGSLTVNPGFGLTMFGDIANYAGTNGLVMQADATGMGQLGQPGLKDKFPL